MLIHLSDLVSEEGQVDSRGCLDSVQRNVTMVLLTWTPICLTCVTLFWLWVGMPQSSKLFDFKYQCLLGGGYGGSFVVMFLETCINWFWNGTELWLMLIFSLSALSAYQRYYSLQSDYWKVGVHLHAPTLFFPPFLFSGRSLLVIPKTNCALAFLFLLLIATILGKRDWKKKSVCSWFALSYMIQFSCSVMSNSATPWTAARQAFLSFTNSWSLLKLMSIESVMPSNHLIFCRPLLPLSLFPSIRVFSKESVLLIRWPKYWNFSFSISPSNEYSGLI